MKYKIYKRVDKELLKEWLMLSNRAINACLFNSYKWYLVCKNTLQSEQIEIVCFYEGSRLVCVLPLIKKRKFGIYTKQTLIDKYGGCKPLLVESYDKKLFDYVVKVLLKEGSVCLNKMPIEECHLIAKDNPRLLISIISVNPYLKLNNEPFRNISRNNRSKTKSILKRNGSKIDFVLFKNNLQPHLKDIFSIEQNSSKKTASKDIFSKIENQLLYKNIIKYCGKDVEIFMGFYNLKPFVYTFNLKIDKKVLCYHTAYLNDLRGLSPGKILTYKLLDKLSDDVIESIDFGEGINTFKLDYADEYYLLFDIYISENSIVSMWWKIVNYARRINQFMFPAKNSYDYKFLFRSYSNAKSIDSNIYKLKNSRRSSNLYIYLKSHLAEKLSF